MSPSIPSSTSGHLDACAGSLRRRAPLGGAPLLLAACALETVGSPFEYAPLDEFQRAETEAETQPDTDDEEAEILADVAVDPELPPGIIDDPMTPPSDDDPDTWSCDEGDPAITIVDGGSYPQLDVAVAAAPPGGTIRVCPGLYLVNLVIDHPLTIRGWDATTTVLDGQLAASVIRVEGVSFTLESVTLRHGEADAVVAAAEVACGGGLAVEYDRVPQQLTVRDVLLTDNHAHEGGGMCIGGAANVGMDALLEDVTFLHNSALADGGGLSSRSETDIVGSAFVGNFAGGHGGAMVVRYDFVTFADSIVHGNSAASGGGGAYLLPPSTLTISSSDWGAGQANENTADDLACPSMSVGWLGEGVDATCWAHAFDDCACE